MHKTKSINWTLSVVTALAAVGAIMTPAPQGTVMSTSPLIEEAQPQIHGAMPASCCQMVGALDKMVEEADLVFQGTVLRVDYANSTPVGTERPALPHTFVTYSVQRVLSGEDPGSTLMLRFIGGPSTVSGNYLRTSITPQFDVGDNDILFVAGNGERMSPLVANRSGRLRVIGGQVYSDTGRAVNLDEADHIQLGARHALEEVRTTLIRGEVIETERIHDPATTTSDAMAPQPLLATLERLGLQRKSTARRFQNSFPWEPFTGPDMAVAAMPQETLEATQPESLEEQQQRELHRKQDQEFRRSIRRTPTETPPRPIEQRTETPAESDR